MITYFIYFIVFLILSYVTIIAVKAITRGIEAKENMKSNLNEKEKDDDILNFEEENQSNLVNKIKELNSLYDQGVLNKEEFEKAKKKNFRIVMQI